MSLSERFEQAFVVAFRLHAEQERKGSGVPYITHLMATAALTLQYGGDEDQAIAALLHDAVEDQGGKETLDEIRARFGDRVALIVAGCSDSFTIPKPAWRERKEAYLRHLVDAPEEILLVSCADKLHNALSILADYRKIGEALWERFTGGKEGTLWYYRSLVQVFNEVTEMPIAAELARTVAELDALTAQVV